MLCLDVTATKTSNQKVSDNIHFNSLFINDKVHDSSYSRSQVVVCHGLSAISRDQRVCECHIRRKVDVLICCCRTKSASGVCPLGKRFTLVVPSGYGQPEL